MRSVFALALGSLLIFAVPTTARAADAPGDVIAQVRAATAQYLDIARARADGFVRVSDMEPRHGYHFMNTNASIFSVTTRLISGSLDLHHPPMLLYVQHDGIWQLVGVEYALPQRPAGNPFPGATWHEHEPSCHYRDYRELPRPTARECPPRHPETGAEFVLFHPALAVAHVWAWYPNPLGPFAEENPYLAPYGGQAAPGGHVHALSGTQIAYSEFNHRSSGAFLVVIAALLFWELRRARRLPWSLASSALWIAFGVYLFVRSDPEAWPWGPKPFAEIFSDSEVLQHKILTLLPVLIGAVDALRKTGRLGARAWRYALPALVLFGGAYLFFHFHDGRFHLDKVYLQHAAMGTAGLTLGVVALAASRRPRAPTAFSVIFPALVLLLGVILLFYSEA